MNVDMSLICLVCVCANVHVYFLWVTFASVLTYMHGVHSHADIHRYV